MLALACGSIAFAQDQFAPLAPADSAAKALAQGAAPAGFVEEMVEFRSGSRWQLTVNAVQKFGLVITGASFQKSPVPRLSTSYSTGASGKSLSLITQVSRVMETSRILATCLGH